MCCTACGAHVLQYALVFMTGLPTGKLFDMGYLRLPVGIASACLVTATFLVGQCTEFWQFLLCQGIFAGVRSLAVVAIYAFTMS